MTNAIKQGMLAIQYLTQADIYAHHGTFGLETGDAGSLVLPYSGDDSGGDPPENNNGLYACICAHLPPPAPPRPPMMPGCSNVARTMDNLERLGPLQLCKFQIPTLAECEEYANTAVVGEFRTWRGAEASSSSLINSGPGCYARDTGSNHFIHYNTEMHPLVAVLTDPDSRMVCYRGRACDEYTSGSCQVMLPDPQTGIASAWDIDMFLSEWDNSCPGDADENYRANQPVLTVGTSETDKMLGPTNHLQSHLPAEIQNGRVAWNVLSIDFDDDNNKATANCPAGSQDGSFHVPLFFLVSTDGGSFHTKSALSNSQCREVCGLWQQCATFEYTPYYGPNGHKCGDSSPGGGKPTCAYKDTSHYRCELWVFPIPSNVNYYTATRVDAYLEDQLTPNPDAGKAVCGAGLGYLAKPWNSATPQTLDALDAKKTNPAYVSDWPYDPNARRSLRSRSLFSPTDEQNACSRVQARAETDANCFLSYYDLSQHNDEHFDRAATILNNQWTETFQCVFVPWPLPPAQPPTEPN